MEKLSHQIDACILLLQEMKEDAEKCDNGRPGAPGTRLRKSATDMTKRMKQLRADVIELRNAD